MDRGCVDGWQCRFGGLDLTRGCCCSRLQRELPDRQLEQRRHTQPL
jgi:hypothetical protein